MSGNTGPGDGSKENGSDDSKKDNSDGSRRNPFSMMRRGFRNFRLPSSLPAVFGVPPRVHFRGFGLLSYFPIFGVPPNVHPRSQERNAVNNQEEQPLSFPRSGDRAIRLRRNLRRLWFFAPVLTLLSVGGAVYYSGISWSDFEAPFVSELQLSTRSPVSVFSLITGDTSSIVSAVSNRVTSILASVFVVPPNSRGFYRVVMSWLRFLCFNFLSLSPRMQIVAVCIVHLLCVITMHQILSLGWGASSYLLNRLYDLLLSALSYLFPTFFPPPPPAQINVPTSYHSSVTYHGPVSFHGPVRFLSSVYVGDNLIANGELNGDIANEELNGDIANGEHNGVIANGELNGDIANEEHNGDLNGNLNGAQTE
ncbi:uncharacterized protein LOC133728309 [Rosa rugosa]|uniref:uncharacterized protein LOC133728309 n=1 Tax=Rosa rugosa TaxID=74645 RepID=UPI002B40C592|nr:uncharacterized protein LOC133728309 [Rosa rugosa]